MGKVTEASFEELSALSGLANWKIISPEELMRLTRNSPTGTVGTTPAAISAADTSSTDQQPSPARPEPPAT